MRRGRDFRPHSAPASASLACPGLASGLPFKAIRPTLARSFRLPPSLASRFQPVRIPFDLYANKNNAKTALFLLAESLVLYWNAR